MHVWFWAWVLLAAVFVAVELLERKMYTLPWAFGTVVAAVLDAAGVWVGWQWIALLVVSSAVLIGAQRFVRPSRKSLRRGRKRSRR